MTDRQVKLDWFSFTFPITLLGEKDNENTLRHILSALSLHTSGRLDNLTTDHLWTWGEGHNFYSNNITHPLSHIRINWSAGNPYAQCELSGKACDMVTSAISPADLARSANGRCTRLDIAVDMETPLKPEEFCQDRSERRFATNGAYTSPQGDTVYIGSRQSERMARVYRYNPPHPREKLLRIEVELKGDAAKAVCEKMCSTPLTEIAEMVNAPFGWHHPIWLEGKLIVSKIPARTYDKQGDGRLHWLARQVIPSLRQMHEEGIIDLFNLIETYFPDLKP